MDIIREANKQNGLSGHYNISTINVVFCDEASIQIETHRLCCYRKKGERPKPKPRPKKVHIWAGISMHGATDIYIFRNYGCKVFFLNENLLPFLRHTFSNGLHRFMQDNDPKHCSRIAKQFFEDNNINWWHTPPESPDFKPYRELVA